MNRPFALNILMWFCAIYAIGAVLGIGAAILDLGRFIGGYSIGGMRVTREHWLIIAGPLVAGIAILMGATAFALKRHRTWARITFMAIWLLILAYGIGCAVLGAVCAAPILAKSSHPNWQRQARLTKKEAERIALGGVNHGRIKSAELEQEDGLLVWSFDIVTPETKSVTEGWVDATTGEIASLDIKKPAVPAREKSVDGAEK